MSFINRYPNCVGRLLLAGLLSGMTGTGANAAIEVLGVQYQQDNPYSEYNCWYHLGNYPTSCGISITGCNAHVFLKNTGASAVTINDVNFAGYNLNTILKTVDFNGHFLSSIYLYWDDPPSDIFNAGEPVWYRADPNPIPAGGTARVVVRLRKVPVTQPISVGVATSAGTVNTNVPVDASAPVLASVGFSTNRTRVYLHWRRNGGAAPTSVWLNGTNVNSLTTTVGDPTMNFAVSVIQLPTALPNMSYHVFQGRYADGKTATGSLRVWVNRFLYGTWGVREIPDNDDAAAQAWIAECQRYGVNIYVNNSSGGLNDFMGTQAGRDYAEARDYGYVKDSNAWGTNPRMWFVDDEPDFEEANTEANFCGTGLRIPCGGGHTTGTLGRHLLAHGETLRAQNPMAPTTINLDGGFKPDGWYAYGQFADVMMVDSYYEGEQAYVHWNRPNAIPLFRKSTSVYAAAIATTTAAEPNPMHIILNSVENKDTATGEIWPFAAPANKRIQVYYALAGGAKGMAYWWFKKGYPYNGLDANTTAARALWKEIGLCGNEIKTAQPLLVISHPVRLPLVPGANVWARALAADTNALLLIVANDNYLNDQTGTYVTNVPNASVTATLPSWLVNPNLTAFEISAGGINDVTTVLNGSQLQVLLGTLTATRMVVVTTSSQWRTAIQQRYDQLIRANVCAFAPELCVNQPPGITQQPANQSVIPGGTANFAVVLTGTSPLGYRWQKNQVNLSDGGHYSGCTTPTLTVTGANQSDVASYRCVVTNAYGSTNSASATLTLAVYDPCLGVTNADFESGFALAGGGYIATNWTEWETDTGVIVGYDESGIVHGGAHAQRLRVSGDTNGSSGGVYQRVPVVVGQPFTASVWTYAGDTATACYLGVDPTGGTNPASGVTWSTANSNTAWVQTTVTGTATTSYLTVYLKVASADSTKRNGYFDDAISAGCVTTPPGITQQPEDKGVVVGGTAYFSVLASGSEPLNYQWQKSSPDGPPFTNLSDVGHYAGSTTDVLTISNADANDGGGYRCVVTNAYGSTNSSAATLTVLSPNACLGVLNPGFEEGFILAGGGYIATNWTEWEAWAGVTTGYDETGIVHGGAHSQRVRVSSTGATSGGVYQRVPVTAGNPYSISVWIYADTALTSCYLGVDPAGGTNASSGVVWSTATTNVSWVQKTWVGTATANYLTVFYKVATPDNVKRNGYFDDGTPLGSGGPLRLTVQGNGIDLTLLWPECPGAHLERTDGLLAPMSWATATNQVSVANGQKSVTFTPAGSAGYFRLVLE